jgi:hypothetical protein
MRWGRIRTTSVLAGSFALLAVAANAQPISVHRSRYIEAAYSPNDTLSQSVARVAVRSTLPTSSDAKVSRQDLFSLMVLLSLPNKHPS